MLAPAKRRDTNDTRLQHMTASIAALHCSGRCNKVMWAFWTDIAWESAVQRTGRDDASEMDVKR
jgi:hypothetical protein